MNYSHPRNEEKHFGFPFRTVPKVVNDNDNKSNKNNKNNFNYLLAQFDSLNVSLASAHV